MVQIGGNLRALRAAGMSQLTLDVSELTVEAVYMRFHFLLPPRRRGRRYDAELSAIITRPARPLTAKFEDYRRNAMRIAFILLLGIAISLVVSESQTATAAVKISQGRNSISGLVYGESRTPLVDTYVQLLDELGTMITQ